MQMGRWPQPWASKRPQLAAGFRGPAYVVGVVNLLGPGPAPCPRRRRPPDRRKSPRRVRRPPGSRLRPSRSFPRRPRHNRRLPPRRWRRPLGQSPRTAATSSVLSLPKRFDCHHHRKAKAADNADVVGQVGGALQHRFRVGLGQIPPVHPAMPLQGAHRSYQDNGMGN